MNEIGFVEYIYDTYKQAESITSKAEYVELLHDIHLLDSSIRNFNQCFTQYSSYNTELGMMVENTKIIITKYEKELNELHCFDISVNERKQRQQKPNEIYHRDEAANLAYCLKRVFIFKILKSIRDHYAEKAVEKMKNNEPTNFDEIATLFSKTLF